MMLGSDARQGRELQRERCTELGEGKKTMAHSAYLMMAAQAQVGSFPGHLLRSSPQRQKASSFNVDDVMRQMTEGHGSK